MKIAEKKEGYAYLIDWIIRIGDLLLINGFFILVYYISTQYDTGIHLPMSYGIKTTIFILINFSYFLVSTFIHVNLSSNVIHLDKIVEIMKAAENTGDTVNLMELKGEVGSIAKMLAEDLLHVMKEPDSLQLYYKPQYDRNDRCIGAEALLRWNHPRCGII